MKHFCIIFLLFIFPNCSKEQNNIFPEKKAPILLPNITEVIKYTKYQNINYNNVLTDLHESFKKYNISGLFGYNWYNGIVLADLNDDATFELYLNASIGSGVVHSFIHGYDPINNNYYILSKRMDVEYHLFIYSNVVYISSYKINEKEINIYKPKLMNKEIKLEDISEDLTKEIKELKIKLYYPFEMELVKNNINLNPYSKSHKSL
jgi:hypothetical protein